MTAEDLGDDVYELAVLSPSPNPSAERSAKEHHHNEEGKETVAGSITAFSCLMSTS